MLGRLVSCSFLANGDPFCSQAQARDVILRPLTMSQAHQVAARVVSERCCKRKCLAKDADAPLLCCAKEGCPKKIHTLRCQELVFKPQKAKDEEKGNITNLLGENEVACDGKHHGKTPNDQRSLQGPTGWTRTYVGLARNWLSIAGWMANTARPLSNGL